jgi:hypothetical protein
MKLSSSRNMSYPSRCGGLANVGACGSSVLGSWRISSIMLNLRLAYSYGSLKMIGIILKNTVERDAPKEEREMLIRQDFHSQTKLPPRMFLEQVMDALSKAYCFLWDHKDEQNRFSMTWKELSVYYHKHAFRSTLRKLCNHGLLSYDESGDGVSIELVGWDEVVAGG